MLKRFLIVLVIFIGVSHILFLINQRKLFFINFVLIYYFGMRKNLAFKEVVRRNSFKTYIWDVFFILSLIVVIYILSNNIRIII